MSGVRVWAALVALTLVEVGLAWVHTAPALMLGLLVALSLGKAGLIAWYFMHLREWRPRPLLLFFPMLAVCVMLLLALLPEGLRAGVMR